MSQRAGLNVCVSGFRSPDRPARSELLYRLSCSELTWLAAGEDWTKFSHNSSYGRLLKLLFLQSNLSAYLIIAVEDYACI